VTKTIHEFIKERPQLIWYVRDLDALDEASIVEHTLNYGSWDDVMEMIDILGMERTAAIFRQHAFRKRTNYHKKTAHYFNLFFHKYA